MNIENLKKLKAFFDAGAPHFHFNMTMPLISDIEFAIKRYHDEEIPSTCGSAGCIAGAAAQMAGANTKGIGLDEMWIDVTRPEALKFCGFPEPYEDRDAPYAHDAFFGHDLFDPDLAPFNCTPQQAAQAIQNVIDGRAPWVGVV